MENCRKSKIKRARKSGFLVRQGTKKGRQMNARKRRRSGRVTIANKAC
jgi:ribosomal protein L34